MGYWAGGIYTESRNEKTHILLTRTGPTAEWSLPGGKQLDENESPIATFVREIYEEINIVAWPGMLIFAVKEPDHLRYIFEIEPETKIIESETIRFFPLTALPQNLRERHRQILRHLYRNYFDYEKKSLSRKNSVSNR